MATEAERAALRGLGNEILLPLAVKEPLGAAVEVLAERGNTVVNGGLEKMRRTLVRGIDGTVSLGTVRVRNGKVVEVDGVPR